MKIQKKKYMYQCNMCCPELRETFPESTENILLADEPFTPILTFSGDDLVIIKSI